MTFKPADIKTKKEGKNINIEITQTNRASVTQSNTAVVSTDDEKHSSDD